MVGLGVAAIGTLAFELFYFLHSFSTYYFTFSFAVFDIFSLE